MSQKTNPSGKKRLVKHFKEKIIDELNGKIGPLNDATIVSGRGDTTKNNATNRPSQTPSKLLESEPLGTLENETRLNTAFADEPAKLVSKPRGVNVRAKITHGTQISAPAQLLNSLEKK